MWPFKKRKSAADDAIQVMGPAAAVMSTKWLMFFDTLGFRDDVSLGEKITMFAIPAMEGMRENYPELREAPDTVLLMVVAAGIKRAGTHSAIEIADALTPPGASSASILAAIDALPTGKD